MSKIIAIFGATGRQGGSLAKFVLSDLADKFTVRVITRNASKPESVALSEKGAQVVVADFDDASTLDKAVAGADTVFANTLTQYAGATPFETEVAQGKAIADACVRQGVRYLIWSSGVNAASVVKDYRVDIMQAKFEVEKYIRSLPIKSSFYAPGTFMQNFTTVYKFLKQPDGSFVTYTIFDQDTELPMVDITETDKFIEPILLNPEEYEGKTLAGFTKWYSISEAAQILSEKTGKTVRFVKIPDEVAAEKIPEPMLNMLKQFRDYGYYCIKGEERKKQTEWWLAQPLRKLTTLEKFLDKHPLVLE